MSDASDKLLHGSESLTTTIELMNILADPGTRLHLIDHIQDKMKDPEERGCTPEIDAFLDFAFKKFSALQLQLLCDGLKPSNVEVVVVSNFEEFLAMIDKDKKDLH